MYLRNPCRIGSAALVALLVVIAAACGSSGVKTEAELDEQAQAASGSDEIYDLIVGTLDYSYDQLSRPPVDFDNLDRVKDHAFEQLSDRAFDWPTGTSYSLSVLSDRVAIYVNCDGVEKRGDWAPDA